MQRALWTVLAVLLPVISHAQQNPAPAQPAQPAAASEPMLPDSGEAQPAATAVRKTHFLLAAESQDGVENALNVLVTIATKRSERLEDAPGSVTVVTKDMMRDMNALTLRDVLNVYIPGMDVVPTYFRYGDRVSEGIYS